MPSRDNKQLQFIVLCGLFLNFLNTKHPRSSFICVLVQLQAAKPSWAEGCPAGCPAGCPGMAKWAMQMIRNATHGRDLARHFVWFSLCHWLLPKELTHVNIVYMFWCVDTIWRGPALSPMEKQQVSSVLITTISTSAAALGMKQHTCPSRCFFWVKFGPVEAMETLWVCCCFSLVHSNNLQWNLLFKVDAG